MCMELGYGNMSKVRHTSKNGGDMRSIKEMLEDEDAFPGGYGQVVDVLIAFFFDGLRWIFNAAMGV